MAYNHLSTPIFHMDDPATGAPLVGGLVYTYSSGTSSALTTYSDAELTTPNANPIVLDSYGNAKIFYTSDMKIVVRSSDTLTTYYTFDDIQVSQGTVTGDFNLVLNGSFESATNSSPDFWTVTPYSGATISTATTAVAHGRNGLVIDGGGAGGGSVTSSTFDVLASSRLTVMFSYYVSNATTTNSVVVYWLTKSGGASSTPSTTLLSAASGHPTSFTRMQYNTAVPSDATRAYIKIIGIDSGGSNLSANAYFDDVIAYCSGISYTEAQISSAVAEVNNTVTTFTPTLVGSSTAGTPTYTTQLGHYINIGSITVLNIDLAISAKGGATGNLTIRGLPTISGAHTSYAVVACRGATGLTDLDSQVLASYDYSNNRIDLSFSRHSVTGGWSLLNDGLIDNSFEVRFSMIVQGTA